MTEQEIGCPETIRFPYIAGSYCKEMVGSSLPVMGNTLSPEYDAPTMQTQHRVPQTIQCHTMASAHILRQFIYRAGKGIEWVRTIKPVIISVVFSLIFACIALAGGNDQCVQPSPHFATDLLALINEYRHDQGLKALSFTEKLGGLAQDHSTDMCNRGILSHDNFDRRFARSGSTECVENVGLRFTTAREQFLAWKKSPAHNANMLTRDVRHAGIARVGTSVTFFACK